MDWLQRWLECSLIHSKPQSSHRRKAYPGYHVLRHMLQRKKIAIVLYALLLSISTTLGQGEAEPGKRNDVELKPYHTSRERLDATVSTFIKKDGADLSNPEIKANLSDASELSSAKVVTVIRATNQRELQIGDPRSTFERFFGPDFPPASSYIDWVKSVWIKIDLFPNRVFKDPKHVPVGWMLWIEIGRDQKVISYFLTDQRKLNARQLGQ